jgi:mevalonate kinase
MARGSAPGKVILLGEHAVVYGRPAIAVPVRQVRAEAEARAGDSNRRADVHVLAPEAGVDAWLSDMADADPLGRILQLTLAELQVIEPPELEIEIRSTIPIAGGLGSGAAVSVAIIRALAEFFDRPITLDRQSALAFEVERLHHGNPSGIDNTVVVYDQPVYFRRGEDPRPFRPVQPIHLVVGDSGIASPTAQAVALVAQQRESRPQEVDSTFDRIASVVVRARAMLEGETPFELGYLMDQNHELLRVLGVSTAELDSLVAAARRGGALGAKLSGAGLGGNVIALVSPSSAPAVADAMAEAGARRTIVTEVAG